MVGVHAVASAVWALSMRAGAGFGRSAVILILANMGGALLASWLVFGETLTRQQTAGLVVAGVAVILLA